MEVPFQVPSNTIVPQASSQRVARVLYLTDLRPADKFGSLEEQIFVLAQALRRAGGLLLPVFGAAVGPETSEQYQSVGCRVEWLDLHTFEVDTLRKLLALIGSNQIEIVHWNFYSPLNRYFLLLPLLRPQLRHFLTDHNSRLPHEQASLGSIKRTIKRKLLKRYERVLGISNFVVDCLREQEVWPTVSRCIYFINTDRFAPDDVTRKKIRNSLGAENKFAILFAGNQIRWKGGDIAIRALAELPHETELWVIGDGNWLSFMQQLAAELGVADRIRFLGSQRNIAPYMKSADCFICPSVWKEATGLVNLEALACGLPVVASEIGGIPEFIDHGRTGLLFEAGNYQQLATSVMRLMNEPSLAAAMSQAARSTAVDRFSIERRLPDYLELYSSN